jgi:hypothetical protein
MWLSFLSPLEEPLCHIYVFVECSAGVVISTLKKGVQYCTEKVSIIFSDIFLSWTDY